MNRMDEQNIEEQGKKKMNLGREILSWAVYLLIVVALTYFILHFVGQRTMVDGMSMYPTLEDGDNLIVEKLSYRFGDPQRFDIIVFPYDDHTYYIKRIIGLPEKRYRLTRKEPFILTERFWKKTTERKSSAIRDGRPNRCSWERTSILSWATTGTTAKTAGPRR